MTTADPIAAFRSELRAAANRQRRSSQRRLVAAAVVALVAIIALTGVATGGVGWLTGTPAPHSVIADFGTYTPQLGFHPDPGSAVLVASDGDSHLYATTNAEEPGAGTRRWNVRQQGDCGEANCCRTSLRHGGHRRPRRPRRRSRRSVSVRAAS